MSGAVTEMHAEKRQKWEWLSVTDTSDISQLWYRCPWISVISCDVPLLEEGFHSVFSLLSGTSSARYLPTPNTKLHRKRNHSSHLREPFSCSYFLTSDFFFSFLTSPAKLQTTLWSIGVTMKIQRLPEDLSSVSASIRSPISSPVRWRHRLGGTQTQTFWSL